MATSIRTEFAIGAPGDCPIASASVATGATISHVARSSATNRDGMLTEEFTVDDTTSIDRPDIEPVFEFDSRSVYRFERERDRGCVCECIEQYGCPVSDIHARDGTLIVSFYAPDVETVKDVVAELQRAFDEIHVQRLTRADNPGDHDFVFVDRERLTARQREVLRTSYELGYFDHPKRANAGDVAEAMEISPSTFSEHLAAAQRNLLETILQA